MSESYEPIVPGSLDEINLLDVKLQNCPYHAYEMLRDEAPVWIDPITGFYVITRFEDIRTVSYTHLTLPTKRIV